MPLATTHTNWNNGSYEADRKDLILPFENAPLLASDTKRGIHNDGLSTHTRLSGTPGTTGEGRREQLPATGRAG